MSGVDSFSGSNSEVKNNSIENSNFINDTRVEINNNDNKPEVSAQEDDRIYGRVGKEVVDADGNKHYLDDNGKEYRINDDILPNNEFTRNGYEYKTDEQGRTVSVEGQLQKKGKRDRYDMDDRATVMNSDGKDSDDRGHLIADMFNGSGGKENLVAMDRELNQHEDYKKMENTLSDALNEGCQVYLKVEPVYKSNSDNVRPTEFKVTYTIDGEKTVSIFKNGSDK